MVLFYFGVLSEVFRFLRKDQSSKRFFWRLIPFLAVLGFIFFFPKLKPAAVGGTLGSVHIHTTCSDGADDYEAVVQEALHLGLKFIAITDHTFKDVGPCLQPGRKCDFKICEEVLEKCRTERRLVCLPSQEVTSSSHILAIGISKAIGGEWPKEEQVKEIHRQGGLAILAHPYAQGYGLPEEEIVSLGFDAIECPRLKTKEGIYWQEVSQRLKIPCIYNSDAHNATMLGIRYNQCLGTVSSAADLKNLLKQGLCSWHSSYSSFVLDFVEMLSQPQD
jgi:hypothetical protein